jgi:hypothetical protein
VICVTLVNVGQCLEGRTEIAWKEGGVIDGSHFSEETGGWTGPLYTACRYDPALHGWGHITDYFSLRAVYGILRVTYDSATTILTLRLQQAPIRVRVMHLPFRIKLGLPLTPSSQYVRPQLWSETENVLACLLYGTPRLGSATVGALKILEALGAFH